MNLTWMLVMACSGQPQYQQACKASAEAGMRQSGLYSFMETIEYSASKRARIEIEQLELTNLLIATTFAFKVIKDKNIGYTFKKPGILNADSLGTSIGPKNGTITLAWNI